MSKEEMEKLLKHGAYHAIKGDDLDENNESEAFFNASIDEILQARTCCSRTSLNSDMYN
jgi:hypothetical protein